MPALSAPEYVLAFCALAYLLGAYWFVTGMRRRSGNANAERVQLVSVVVAARDEAAHIASCLRALLAQDYPQERYEIIVVDDGSTDGTGHIVREFQRGDCVREIAAHRRVRFQEGRAQLRDRRSARGR